MTVALCRECSTGSVLDQGMDGVAGELVFAVEEGQLDQEDGADDDAAELLDELTLRLRRTTCREHVVEHDDARARSDRVPVHLQAVRPVLEVVRRLDCLPRKLPRLPCRDEAR